MNLLSEWLSQSLLLGMFSFLHVVRPLVWDFTGLFAASCFLIVIRMFLRVWVYVSWLYNDVRVLKPWHRANVVLMHHFQGEEDEYDRPTLKSEHLAARPKLFYLKQNQLLGQNTKATGLIWGTQWFWLGRCPFEKLSYSDWKVSGLGRVGV